MTPRRVLAAAALLLLLPSWRTNAQKRGKNIDDASLSALQTWVKAVNTHTPGRVDAPVVVVAGFSYETREDLDSGRAGAIRPR